MTHLPAVGMHRGVSYDTYAAWPATRSGDLKAFDRTALHAHFELTHPRETDSLRLGQATHVAILEPARFAEQYAVAPNVDRRTKAGREAWLAFQGDNEGRIILTSEEYDRAAGMSRAAWAHPIAGPLLGSEGVRESSILWLDPKTKRPCKARLDLLCNWCGEATVVDIKTTKDASPRSFARDSEKYGYHISAAWYLEGLRELAPAGRQYVLLAIESAEPFVTAVYLLDEEFIEAGRKTAEDRARRLWLAQETGHWPGYESLEVLCAPPWTENLQGGF